MSRRIFIVWLFAGVLGACVEIEKSDPSATSSGAATSSSGGVVTSMSSGATSASSGATTGALACELVALTNAAAEVLGPVKDCGIVDPWNSSLADWEAAVDCVLTASAGEMPFKMVAWRQGIDSMVGAGYFGVAAESFARGTILYDSYGAGSASQRACTAFVATPACVVTLGEPCLTCEGEGQGVELCPG